MATFRELATSKGERRWQAVVRRKGMPHRFATFATKRAAERWALSLEGQVAEQRHLPQLEAERHTLNDLFKRWEPELSPGRRHDVQAHLSWWREALGDKRLSEMTSATIRQQRDRLLREPYTRSKPRKVVTLTARRGPTKPPKVMLRGPGTANSYLATLSKALSTAVREYEWMPLNPCANIADLPIPAGRVRFLTDTERTKLLAACKEQSADLYALAVCALCTGARSGELLSLRWPDVDLARQRAVLHKTKNADRRALALTGPALTVLKARHKARRIDTDLVFPHPGLKKPFDYAKQFNAALAAAGVKNFRFHDLRHTAASYLAMNGATTAEIAAVLGHKTLQMVKRYSHLSDTHVDSVVGRMTDKIFGGAAS